jgi:hypothetical protein
MKSAQQQIAKGASATQKAGLRKRSATFSALEARTLLSGAVAATVEHGQLNLTGDNAANFITLSQAGLDGDQVRISGSKSTRINGQGSVIIDGVSRGISILLAGGADNIKLRDLSVRGNLTIQDYQSGNTVTLNNVEVEEDLRIKSGGNRASVKLAFTTVGDGLSITSGSRGHTVSLTSVSVEGETSIASTGTGKANLSIDDSYFKGDVGLDTGRGADAVYLDTHGSALGVPTTFAERLTVNLNDGNDLLQMGLPDQAGNRSVFLNRRVSRVTDGFLGMDPVSGKPQYAARVTFNGGKGRDTLEDFDASTYQGPARFHVSKFERFTQSSEGDTTAPTVSSTSPLNNAINVATNRQLAVVFSEVMDASTITNTTITVTRRGAKGRQIPVTGIVTYVGTTATFMPSGGFTVNTSYTATVNTNAKDVAGNAMSSSFVSHFRTGSSDVVDATAPSVSSVDPTDGSTGVALNKRIAATFSEVMDPTTVNAQTLTVSRVNGDDETAVAGTVAYVGLTVTFTPTVPLAGNTTYIATIHPNATDLAGNELASDFVWSFVTGATADTTAPTVISNDPDDAETGVALNKMIAATFSEAMDPLSITAANVLLTGPGSTPVVGAVTYAGTTMNFTPAVALLPNTVYSVAITTGVTDLAGNALASNADWSFTTGAAPDLVAPTVTLTSPLDTATNVVRNKTVAATFSEAMDVSTITTATYTLEGPGGVPVTGTVTYNALSHIASFVPTTMLASNTLYTATIASGINGAKDLAGNALLVDKVWSFTTGSQIAQDTIQLGAAGAFAVMATSDIVSSGPTVINGDVGLAPGTSQGIPTPQVNGTIHVNDSAVLAAQAALLAAYNDAVGRSVSPGVLPGNMGGLTFTPGLYVNSTSVLISGAGSGNIVTLDAQGDPNAIFIFKMGTTLTTGPSAQVVLAGGAKATNIYWQVGSSATLNTATQFKGNILASVTITVNTGSIIEGRLLGGSNTDGSVTINSSTVTLPIA